MIFIIIISIFTFLLLEYLPVAKKKKRMWEQKSTGLYSSHNAYFAVSLCFLVDASGSYRRRKSRCFLSL